MEVSPRKRFVRFGEDQRIVGDSVRLDEEGRRRLAQEIEAGPHHLRLAAQAIGILHPFVAGQMRSANGASLEQRAQRGRDFDLARVASQRVDARVERRIRSARAIGRQRAGRQGGAEQRLGLEQADERIGGRELRAVEERKPLLGLKRDRLEADFGERGVQRAQCGRRHEPRRRRSSPPPYARAARDRPTRRPTLATGPPASRRAQAWPR